MELRLHHELPSFLVLGKQSIHWPQPQRYPRKEVFGLLALSATVSSQSPQRGQAVEEVGGYLSTLQIDLV